MMDDCSSATRLLNFRLPRRTIATLAKKRKKIETAWGVLLYPTAFLLNKMKKRNGGLALRIELAVIANTDEPFTVFFILFLLMYFESRSPGPFC